MFDRVLNTLCASDLKNTFDLIFFVKIKTWANELRWVA